MPVIKEKKNNKYIEAIGRRKTAVARVRLTPAAKNTFKINNRDLASYFPTKELCKVAGEAMETARAGSFDVSVKVRGGGIHSQAEAMRQGVSRALLKHDGASKTKLKTAGFLKRDSRAKERRKFGLKKARKAPQWSKR